jgi:hypothetical protein
MSKPHRLALDRRLAVCFYGSVLLNLLIMWLESSTNLGDSPLYLVLLVPALIALGVTGFLLLRDIFRSRPNP